MSGMPAEERFRSAYAGQPPWDTGRPQPALVESAGLVTGTVLDAGCGTGENALFFAARGHQVTGIDFLQEPIERAKRKAAQRGIAATFLVRDALTLAGWGERFDTVIDSGLFHVFPDDARRRYVEGLARVLRLGGRLLLLCFSDAEPGTHGPRRVSRAELEAAFTEGWELESVTATRFAVVPGSADPGFSEGGPHAWLAVLRRAAAPPPVEAVVETAVYGDDLEAMEAFYSGVLGLPVLGREAGRHVFFRVGTGQVLLAFRAEGTSRGGELPPHGAEGPGHFALGVPAGSLDAWRRHLAACGVAVEKEVTWPRGGRSLYVRDPAGNSVELVTPGVWGTPAGW
jgi:SAM-dependent methyltransferase